MSLPRYSEYKDSGVEWLGEVPAHWLVQPLKHGADFVNGCAFKPEQWVETGIPIIRIENLNGSLAFNCFDGNVDARYYVEQNDLLFGWSGNRGTSFGPFLWPHSGKHFLNQHIFRICNFEFDKSWFYWTLKAVTAHVEDQAHGIIGMVHVTKGDLGAINIPAPSLHEQQSIAIFLDRETAKIDGLIAEQEKLIALLAEKRQATVSHAVTKGLNHDAPMKDSGVAWLGEVPAHWQLKKIKHLTSRISSGKTPLGGSEIYSDKGVMFLRSQNVYDQGLQLDDVVFIPESVDEAMAVSRVEVGDILLNITGASIGRSCLVPTPFPPANVNQHVCVVRMSEPSCRPFIGWFFKSASIKSQIDNVQSGAAREGLNFQQIGEMSVAIPNLDEQAAITTFLNSETTRLDALTEEASRGIALLKERRSALISAAVIGKIDVRHLAELKAA